MKTLSKTHKQNRLSFSLAIFRPLSQAWRTAAPLPFTFILLVPALSGAGASLQGQTVSPVSSRVMLQAPYYYQWHQWSQMPDSRMHLYLRLLDTRVENATLFLRMRIVSDNIVIENPRPLPMPISISGGEEVYLDAGMLAAYFLPANVQTSGNASRDFSLNGGVLPDGLYQLYFEAYEARSGSKVSLNEMPAMFTLLAGEPPFINSPAANDTLYYNRQPSIRFQWTPRHIAAGGFQTEYNFEIAEIPEGVSAWEEYFHTLPLIHQEHTSQTYLDYGQSLPELTPGSQYAFRIQATGTTPDGEQLYIKNNGCSEVQRFYYEEHCPIVPQLRIENISSTRAVVRWTEPIEARSYKLQYRKNGKPDARWFTHGEELMQGDTEAVLEDLEPSTGYECKLSVQCAYSRSKNDIVYRFTTLSADNAHLDCGNHPNSSNPDRDQTPLESLRKFDQVRTANGFVFEIEEATGSDGMFSGSGYTHIPLLSNTGVKVKFKNVFINKNYELVSGTFTAETDKGGL